MLGETLALAATLGDALDDAATEELTEGDVVDEVTQVHVVKIPAPVHCQTPRQGDTVTVGVSESPAVGETEPDAATEALLLTDGEPTALGDADANDELLELCVPLTVAEKLALPLLLAEGTALQLVPAPPQATPLTKALAPVAVALAPSAAKAAMAELKSCPGPAVEDSASRPALVDANWAGVAEEGMATAEG